MLFESEFVKHWKIYKFKWDRNNGTEVILIMMEFQRFHHTKQKDMRI